MIAPIHPPKPTMLGGKAVPHSVRARGSVADDIVPPAPKAPVSAAPSFFGGMINTARTVTDWVMQLDIIMIPVGLLGGAVGWIGSKTGVGAISQTGEMIRKPTQWMGASFSDVGSWMRINKPVGFLSQKAADATGSVVGAASRWTGTGKLAARFHDWSATRHANKAASLAGLELGEIPGAYGDSLANLQSALGTKDVGGIAASVKEIHSIQDGLAKTLEQAQGNAALPKGASQLLGLTQKIESSPVAKQGKLLAKAQKLAGREITAIPSALAPKIAGLQEAIRGGNVGHISASLRGVTEVQEGLQEAVKVAEGNLKLSANAESMLASAAKVASSHAEANVYRDLGGAIKSIPGRIAKAPVGSTLVNGAFVAGSAFSTLDVALGFNEKLGILREMYADMTNTSADKVSTVTLLTGSLPAPLADARWHMLKEHGVRGLIQAAGLVAGVRGLLKNGHFPFIKSFMLPQLGSAGVDMVMGESVLHAYHKYSAAQKQGVALGAEHYAELLIAGSKELRNHKNGRAFAYKLGEQYAAEGASTGHVMHEISNGKTLERIKSITATSDVTSPAVSVEHRPVVGKHTEKLHNEAVNSAGLHTAI